MAGLGKELRVPIDCKVEKFFHYSRENVLIDSRNVGKGSLVIKILHTNLSRTISHPDPNTTGGIFLLSLEMITGHGC